MEVRLIFLFYFFEVTFGAKILILHPIYSGSHVLTLRSVAESLSQRGHQIHIVRWKDQHSFPATSSFNITTTTLAMDNSHGKWNFLTKEKRAAFTVGIHILKLHVLVVRINVHFNDFFRYHLKWFGIQD